MFRGPTLLHNAMPAMPATTVTPNIPPFIPGLKYCSDVSGSKQNLNCPIGRFYSIQNETKCVTDANCGNGNLKCCPSPMFGDCSSYCVVGERNCFNIPKKPDGLCPNSAKFKPTTL
uniref:WAP domain-containing protein n=1 Tax=Strigamia maritima TaxID=126957 RepID=T1IT01_STRMM